jgi:hypothetical protein
MLSQTEKDLRKSLGKNVIKRRAGFFNAAIEELEKRPC